MKLFWREKKEKSEQESYHIDNKENVINFLYELINCVLMKSVKFFNENFSSFEPQEIHIPIYFINT
jgi:hypothetical protein